MADDEKGLIVNEEGDFTPKLGDVFQDEGMGPSFRVELEGPARTQELPALRTAWQFITMAAADPPIRALRSDPRRRRAILYPSQVWRFGSSSQNAQAPNGFRINANVQLEWKGCDDLWTAPDTTGGFLSIMAEYWT